MSVTLKDEEKIQFIRINSNNKGINGDYLITRICKTDEFSNFYELKRKNEEKISLLYLSGGSFLLYYEVENELFRKELEDRDIKLFY